MIEILKETVLDSLKLVPFLFITYLIMEVIEHKTHDKSKKIIKKSKNLGPLFGSLLGVVPQCGFSVSASNLYAVRIISLGTLMSIYLSTSDEMLPVLIANGSSISLMLKIILIKIFIGMLLGFLIDFVFRKKEEELKETVHEACQHEHCHCEDGILKSSFLHTIHILFFIILTILILNIVIHYIGEDALKHLFSNNKLLGPLISSIIGLIPTCSASVIITELLISKTITFGSAIAGLLTNSGLGLLILFKANRNLKENILILIALFFIGIISGIIINII